MKPFAFSLEAVLLVRTREEQAAKEAWGVAMQAFTRAEQNLVAGKWELERQQTALCDLRGDCFRPGDQSMYLNAVAFQRSVCERLAMELKKAAEVARARQTALLQARMKCEVLRRLKENKMNEYQSDLRAREEAAIDDLMISRHGRRGI